MTNAHSTDFEFAGNTLKAIALRMLGSRDGFGKVEIYTIDSDGMEMFLGYADDLGKLGAAAYAALTNALYRDGFCPVFAAAA